MHAYVDESIRLSGGGLYVLAAVVVPLDRIGDVRDELRHQVRPGMSRYHWRDEKPASRSAMTKEIFALGLDAVVVTVRPESPGKGERARRLCLLRLLWELDGRSVVQVVLESRQRRDSWDRRVVSYGRRTGHVPERLHVLFDRPVIEPLLWLPDVVAGAAATACADGDPTYLELLSDRVTLISL